MSRSQVIVIGGPPGAGKSTLGRALAARLGWASVTGDDLIAAATAVTTPDSHPSLHLTRGVGHVEYFTTGPPSKLIADASDQEEAAWPALKRVIRKYMMQSDPLVLDWWLLSPVRVAQLDPPVASLWIHMDADALLARERYNTDFFGASDDSQQMLDNFMARSLWRNDLVLDQAQSVGLPVLEQDGSVSVEELVDRAEVMLG